MVLLGDLLFKLQLRKQPYSKTMKLSIVIVAGILLLSSFTFSIISLKSNESTSNLRLDYDITFQCTSDHWNQFASNKQDHQSGMSRNELKTSLVCTSNTFGDFELEMSHLCYQTKVAESVRLGDGHFKLIGADGDYIVGTYEGYTDETKNHKDILLFLSIEGGTGKYSEVKGYLGATCVPDPENPSIRNLNLKGTIKHFHESTENTLASL